MVLRKPYAFLIKHFKLIHALLALLMIIFSVKIYNASQYLVYYKSLNNNLAEEGVLFKYLGVTGFILPIIILATLVAIIVLMRKKDKPLMIYKLSTLLYVIELVMVIVLASVLSSIQTGTVNLTFMDVVKDFAFTFSLIPIPVIVISIVRAVGFNIKQFNFKKDLIELDITEEDNEEFEVSVDFDSNDIKTRINRSIRFIKYTYLENKKLFFGMTFLIVFVIVFVIIGLIRGVERFNDEGDKFNGIAYSSNDKYYYSNAFAVKINHSYVTDSDLKGLLVNPKKVYVIVNMTIKNKFSDIELKLPYDYIYLSLGNHVQYLPINDYPDSFIDYGIRGTTTTVFNPGEEKTINLVYEIDKKYENNRMIIDYITSYVEGDDGAYKYSKTKINPIRYTKYKDMGTTNPGEDLEFKDSLISGTKLRIDSYDIADKYSTKYIKKFESTGREEEFTQLIIPKETAKYPKVVLRIEATLKGSDNCNPKIYEDFYGNFAQVEYGTSGKMKTQKARLINLSPTSFSDGYVYLEVVEEVKDAEHINLVFTIRDKKYTYKIK